MSNSPLSITMWFLCSCLNICICNWDGVITYLPFTAMWSKMANSWLMSQYFCVSCAASSFLCGQPFTVIAYSSSRFTSLVVASCRAHVDVYTWKCTAVSITLTLCLGLVSLHLCSFYGCVMITNLQWIAQGLACVVCVPCTDGYIELLFFHQWFGPFIYLLVQSVPFSRSIDCCQAPEWLVYFYSLWWEHTQVVYFTQEWLQFSFCFAGGIFVNALTFARSELIPFLEIRGGGFVSTHTNCIWLCL